MITFGTSALFTSQISLGQRAPGAGAAIGQYIKDWDGPIEAAYADARSLGERALVISLAPGGRQSKWVVALDGSDTSDEAAALEIHSAGLRVPSGVRAPILFSISFWVGPTPVDAYGVGKGYPPLPEELRILGEQLSTETGVSIDTVVDVYWRAR